MDTKSAEQDGNFMKRPCVKQDGTLRLPYGIPVSHLAVTIGGPCTKFRQPGCSAGAAKAVTSIGRRNLRRQKEGLTVSEADVSKSAASRPIVALSPLPVRNIKYGEVRRALD